MSEVRMLCAAVRKPLSIRMRDGLKQNMYGTMNAAMASFVAFRPVFMGSDFAIALPAYAASATGGVMSATIPK